MLPPERGPTARALDAAYRGQALLDGPRDAESIGSEQTLLRCVAIQLLHHPKLVAFFRRP